MMSKGRFQFDLSPSDRAAIQRSLRGVSWRTRLIAAVSPIAIAAVILYLGGERTLAVAGGVALGAILGLYVWWRTTAIGTERRGMRLVGPMLWGFAKTPGGRMPNSEWVMVDGIRTYLGDARSDQRPASGSIDRTSKQGFLLAIVDSRGDVTYAVRGYDPYSHAPERSRRTT